MKKKIYQVMFALLLTVSALTTNAATTTSRGDLKAKVAMMTQEQKEARVEEIKARVAVIMAMDRSHLSNADRRALRQELRSMNREARVLGSGGIYLSVGAIIIIILVLILIL